MIFKAFFIEDKFIGCEFVGFFCLNCSEHITLDRKIVILLTDFSIKTLIPYTYLSSKLRNKPIYRLKLFGADTKMWLVVGTRKTMNTMFE